LSKKLTGLAIAQAKAGTKRREVADGGCPGLYMAIHPTGAKSWTLRFRSPTERGNDKQRKAKKLTLGPLVNGAAADDEPQIGRPLSLPQARMLATAALDQVRRGIDPTHVRREEKTKARDESISRNTNTIDAAMVEFLKRYKGKKKQGLRDSTRNLTAHYLGLKPDPENSGDWIKTDGGVLGKWSGRPLTSISKSDVTALVDEIDDSGRGVTANRTLTVLKTFFGWCVKRDKLTASPAASVDTPAEELSRDRVLSDAELLALWRAADGESYPFGRLVQLLILTGARRDELRGAPWSEFDLDQRTWLLPAERSKNGREHVVPLSSAAVEILRGLPRIKGRLLFTTTGTTAISGLSKALDRLRGDADWTLHDLRRTFYSGLQALGFSIEVAEACVNHKSGTLRGVAAVYGRHKYLVEKTAAFEAWARHVDGLVNGDGGASVLPMHGGRR
jgi:integrase